LRLNGTGGEPFDGGHATRPPHNPTPQVRAGRSGPSMAKRERGHVLPRPASRWQRCSQAAGCLGSRKRRVRPGSYAERHGCPAQGVGWPSPDRRRDQCFRGMHLLIPDNPAHVERLLNASLQPPKPHIAPAPARSRPTWPPRASLPPAGSSTRSGMQRHEPQPREHGAGAVDRPEPGEGVTGGARQQAAGLCLPWRETL